MSKAGTSRAQRISPPAGYTLIELVIVTLIIAVTLALALPSVMPVLAFGNLEGAARHLAGYGRAAMGQCTLMHDRFTINIDLENGEYWAVRTFDDEDRLDEEEEDEDDATGDGLFDDTAEPMDTSTLLAQLGQGGSFGKSFGEMDENSMQAMELQSELMRERFDKFNRMSLRARARHVKHDGILDEIGPLFDHEFTLDDEKEEETEVGVAGLERTRLPEGVSFEEVSIGSVEHIKGTVEIEVTPLGLSEPVKFYLKGKSDDDYFTVTWDPITGDARLEEGRGEGFDEEEDYR